MTFSDKHFRLTRGLCFAFAFLVALVFMLRAHILGRFATLAAFTFCLLYINLWLPSNFAFYTAAFGCFQALLAIQQPLAAFPALIATQQPLAAFKL